MADFEVRGSADLARVARELKAAGDGKLRRETLRGIRVAAAPGIPAIRASAAATLPKRGGLAARVAEQPYSIRSSLAAGRVSIVGKGMKELETLDKGAVRHPVYGDRSRWVEQSVTPGFFTKPLERLAPGIRLAVLRVIADIGKQIR